MRLKLKNEKFKIRSFGFLFAFVCSFVFLCCLPLTVFADGLNDGSGGESGTGSAVSLTQFPLPFGGSSGVGYGDYPLTNSICSGALDYANSLYPGYGFSLVCVNEVASDNSYISFRIYIADSDFFLSRGTYPDIQYSLIRNLGSYGSCVIKWDGSSYTEIAGYSYVQYYDVAVDNWLTLVNDVPTVLTDRALYNYPVYYSRGSITGRDGDLFVQYIPPAEDFDGFGFGEMSGSITPAEGVEGQGFDIDFDFFVDMNPLKILGEEIRDGIDTLIDKVEDGFDTVVGAIGDTFIMLQNNTNTLISKIQEIAGDLSKPSQQQLQDAIENSVVLGGVIDLAQKGNEFLDLISAAGIEVPSAEDMEFDLDFKWQHYSLLNNNPSNGAFITHHTPVHISFAWYESIREKVTLVLTVFMSIGFVMYIIKQLPNLIAGVSGPVEVGSRVASATHNSGVDNYGYSKGVKQH